VFVYIDSSVALRAALPNARREEWRAWLDQTKAAYADIVSARLLRTEVIHVLRRDAVPLIEGTKVLSRVRLLAVTDNTFAVAESIERHIKTLDALHLATAVLLGQPLIVATHDKTMREVATALALDAFDPVGDDDAPLPIQNAPAASRSDEPEPEPAVPTPPNQRTEGNTDQQS
jgi:predicted nucleic acid-binding protein